MQVLEQCNGYCDDSAIICLQEVSELWKPKLDQLFRARGYSSAASLYGRPENGVKHTPLAHATGTRLAPRCSCAAV
jgi:hypothetical protein